MSIQTEPRPEPAIPPGLPMSEAPSTAAELRRFSERTPRSLLEWERARRTLPAGVCTNFRLNEPHSIFLDWARGARVRDVDGNEYVDFGMAQTTLLAGHAHPDVLDAVRRQMENGTMTCYPNPRTADLAEIVCDRFRLEQVRFCNTGSEATQFAARVAREATGRDAILKFDACYHGGAAEFWLTLAHPNPPPGAPDWLGQEILSAGVPRAFLSETIVAGYNEMDSVRAAFRDHPKRIAAVILEPIAFNMGVVLPIPGFLEGIREICDAEGALLIYDEVKMGCKLGPLGAGEFFGVPADLVCMAKSIGGGFPIGLFGGRRELMEGIEKRNVWHVGTYAAHHVGLAAARATLTKVLTPDAYRRLFALNQALAEGFRDVIRAARLDAHVVTAGASGSIFWSRHPVRTRSEFAATRLATSLPFYVGMANRGILPQSPGADDVWTVSVQHTGEDIASAVRAFREVAPMLG